MQRVKSGNPLILLNQPIRAVISHALVLIDQSIRAVLRNGRQTGMLRRLRFAEDRLFAGRHRECARGKKGKGQGNQLAFHGRMLGCKELCERAGDFTAALWIKKFRGLMVTIDRNDAAADPLPGGPFSVFRVKRRACLDVRYRQAAELF